MLMGSKRPLALHIYPQVGMGLHWASSRQVPWLPAALCAPAGAATTMQAGGRLMNEERSRDRAPDYEVIAGEEEECQ